MCSFSCLQRTDISAKTFVPQPLGNHTAQSAPTSGQPVRHILDTLTGSSGHAEAWAGVCLQAPLFHSQPPALSQLVSLYLGRSHFLWKEPATMSWLEENVREVLQAVDAGDPAVAACESR